MVRQVPDVVTRHLIRTDYGKNVRYMHVAQMEARIEKKFRRGMDFALTWDCVGIVGRAPYTGLPIKNVDGCASVLKSTEPEQEEPRLYGDPVNS